MIRKLNTISLLVMAAFFLAGSIAEGKIIYVDADATGANDGSSWENAYTYLQDALADANSAEKPVEIRVAQGIYKPNQGGEVHPSNPREATFYLYSGVTLKGGYAGFGEPDANARDTSSYQTILSGDLNGDDISTEDPFLLLACPTRIDNSYHVVDVRSMSKPVVLDGFTITGGNAADREIFPCWSPDLFGGGLRSHAEDKGGNPEVIIRNCIFKSNSASNSGGAIDYYSDRPLTVVDCEFTGNYAANGGAIEADGEENSTMNLTGCTFVGNSAINGAAVSNENRRKSTVTGCVRRIKLTGCVFCGNRAKYGGAAYIAADAPGGSCELEVKECLFAGNRARQYLWTLLDLELSDLTSTELVTSESSADACGGAMYVAGCFVVELTNCTFASNSAPSGNTIACDSEPETSPSNLELHNCILRDEENQICNANGLAIVIEYSDIRGGWAGEGNIDADPLFVAAGYWDSNGTPEDVNDDFWLDGDYHLKAQAGRWTSASSVGPVANEGRWTKDDVTSLCIDAGDPMSPIGYEPFSNGGIINMGAYGGTAEASKSYFGEPPCKVIVAGDINGDCRVDFEDFALMAAHWLEDR